MRRPSGLSVLPLDVLRSSRSRESSSDPRMAKLPECSAEPRRAPAEATALARPGPAAPASQGDRRQRGQLTLGQQQTTASARACTSQQLQLVLDQILHGRHVGVRSGALRGCWGVACWHLGGSSLAGPGSLGRLLPTNHHGANTTTPLPTAAVVVCHDVVRHVRVGPRKHDQPAKTTCRSVEPVEQGAALGGIQDPGSIGNFNTSRFPDQGPGPEIPPDPSSAQQAQPRGRAFVHVGLGHRQWTRGGSFEVFCVLGGPLAAAATVITNT